MNAQIGSVLSTLNSFQHQPFRKPPLVSEEVDDYLNMKGLLSDQHYVSTIKWQLSEMVTRFGGLRIDTITTPMLHQAIFGRNLRPGTLCCVAAAIKALFRWSRSQGHLPPGPTPADAIQIHPIPRAPALPVQILPPGQVERLLWCANGVELRVAIALWSFADLPPAEIAGLHCENLVPGRSIMIKPGQQRPFGYAVRIRPVLNAWLNPFYGRRGAILRSRDLPRRLLSLARKQRIACDRRILHRSFLAYASALASNAQRMCPVRQAASPSATLVSAEEYFSLTPVRVGFLNWPEMVSEYVAGLNAR